MTERQGRGLAWMLFGISLILLDGHAADYSVFQAIAISVTLFFGFIHLTLPTLPTKRE